jgi:DNA-binding GntR family transcriptional regulator
MDAAGDDREEPRVEAVYRQLKAMAVDFSLRPGERLNEGALARDLGTSRTPLREALNRLAAEGLVTFQPGRGFCCRSLDAETVFDLYELRAVLECAAVGLACARAPDAGLAGLETVLAAQADTSGRTVREVTAGDEAFHLAIAGLSGNAELVRQLQGINERIRYIRWIDMQSRVRTTKGEHRTILVALRRRDAPAAVAAMQGHIAKRMDQVVAAVREGYSSIYVPGHAVLFDQPLPAEATGQEERHG